MALNLDGKKAVAEKIASPGKKTGGDVSVGEGVLLWF